MGTWRSFVGPRPVLKRGLLSTKALLSQPKWLRWRQAPFPSDWAPLSELLRRAADSHSGGLLHGAPWGRARRSSPLEDRNTTKPHGPVSSRLRKSLRPRKLRCRTSRNTTTAATRMATFAASSNRKRSSPRGAAGGSDKAACTAPLLPSYLSSATFSPHRPRWRGPGPRAAAVTPPPFPPPLTGGAERAPPAAGGQRGGAGGAGFRPPQQPPSAGTERPQEERELQTPHTHTPPPCWASAAPSPRRW